MPRSIYGKSSLAKPIYGGVSAKQQSQCECIADPNSSPITALVLLRNILSTLTSTIEKFYPPENLNAPFTANMAVRGFISPVVMVRLLWIKKYDNEQFSIDNPLHVIRLKDLYLSLNRDWHQDPFFKTRDADTGES
jgi:hypothetical protein